MVTSGNLHGVTVAHWPKMTDVCSSPTLGTIFPIFITPMTLVAVTMDPVQAMCCMVVESTLFMYMYGHCMYACM